MKQIALGLAVATIASACSLGRDERAGGEPASATRTEEALRADADDGVSLRYPPDWHVSGWSTTNSPRRIAVASYPLPAGAVEGDCGGYAAVEALPPDGAFVLVIDYGEGRSFPEKPGRFALEAGDFAEYECFGPSTMFRFRIADRDLQAHVGLGSETTAETRRAALAVLDSLR